MNELVHVEKNEHISQLEDTAIVLTAFQGGLGLDRSNEEFMMKFNGALVKQSYPGGDEIRVIPISEENPMRISRGMVIMSYTRTKGETLVEGDVKYQEIRRKLEEAGIWVKE